VKYWLDTEFNEDGRTISLISLALVCQDGRELYVCNTATDERFVQPWIRDNVLPMLPPRTDPVWMTRGGIRAAVEDFLDVRAHGKPEFWCYYGASDWVVFYQLWGRLLDLPKGYPKWFHELKQLAADVGNPPLLAKPEGAHSALVDACWNRDNYNYLIRIPRIP
jgi:hypothetical protein